MNRFFGQCMIALLGIGLMLSACNKENDVKKEDWKDKDDYCYELIFPIKYLMPDGSTLTANDKESLALDIKTWYNNHPDVEEKASLKFPVTVSYGDGIEKTFDNKKDMEWAGKACGEKEWEKDFCFDFVYPITFIIPNKGSSITVNSEESLETSLKDWYEANPDAKEELQLQYPVSITMEDGLTKTIENETDMEWAKKACGEEAWDKKDCFELVYPISFTMPDGSTIAGDDEDALWQSVKDWYEANPTVEEKPQLQFPIQIELEDSLIKTIENEEDMKWAKKACMDKDWEEEACFELIFPVNVNMPDGTTITGDDEDALWQSVKDWYEVNPTVEEKPQLQFPVDIIYEDGTSKSINNEEEMIDAKKEC